MKPELVVFTGLQAAGKTSFYRERFAASNVHISKDAWPNARNKQQRQQRLIEQHLRAGHSVVVDNTNPTPSDRAPLIELGLALGARLLCYSFIVTVEQALIRNADRTGRACVDNVAIYSVAKRLVPPRTTEGFEQCFEVELTDAGFVVRPPAICSSAGVTT